MIGHSRPAPFDLADNGPTGLNSYVSPYEAKPYPRLTLYAARKALSLVLAADEVSAKSKSRTRSKSKSQKQPTEVSVPLELFSTHAWLQRRSGEEHC
jgi:hypothetical protein